MLVVDILTYGLALWLGLYLINRDPKDLRLVLAGLGLVAYSLVLALGSLEDYVSDAGLLDRLRWPLLFSPALLWTGSIAYLLSKNPGSRGALFRFWKFLLLPAGILIYFLSLFTGLLVDSTGGNPRTGPLYWLFSLVLLLSWLVVLYSFNRVYGPVRLKKIPSLLPVAGLFFFLSSGFLLFPPDWFSSSWTVFLVGLDLILLGLVIAVLDAFELGEAFLPDFLLSLDFSFFSSLLLGGQVALVMIFATGVTFPMLLLLLVVIATVITGQTFSARFQALLDNFAFARFPGVRRERAELRAVSEAIPRSGTSLMLADMDETEFIRLTRLALSFFGDLSRLAASPLTHLPQIENRLSNRGANFDTLEKANELKNLLAESIDRLKPRGKGDFGTADEWRYYNALYFPYVRGLKPYSRRFQSDSLAGADLLAFEWFRDNIPERTLHNWQNAAAKLIALDLLEKKPLNLLSDN